MVHELQELLVRFNGSFQQLIYQVGIAQVVENIGWGCPLLYAILLKCRVDIVTCIEQVLDSFVLLVRIVQKANTNFVFQLVIARIRFKKRLVEGKSFTIFFKEEPGFGIQVCITYRISLSKYEGRG